MDLTHPLQFRSLTKRFGPTLALDQVDWDLPRGSSVGLIGRNGAGKSTLLHTALGLVVPTSGECLTLGERAAALGAEALSRIGFVDQSVQLLDWLDVGQHIEYVAAMQPRWDRDLERVLVNAFELDRGVRVGSLSGGMRQRLAVLLAVAHRPALLLLDEPVSAQDPVARVDVLKLLLERVVDDGTTLVISSHVLRDVEKVVDRVLCLDAGRVVADEELDTLKERYAEWIVTRRGAALPTRFDEPYVLAHEGHGELARLSVDGDAHDLAAFRARHGVDVERRPLELERIFPLLARAARQGVHP